ncbi:uncharacterized protein BO88DRAFT_406700 [Aspergillus vadensis CBS 113365]|uniref:Uncharacterized protein n=1 Tax=Aspergillus vadensis (strain CBS 113365 / IMI 142717 / IBT 24658) TaxID=1448311 RepID=A0A319B4C2_ASPVC|nr:hypothetical protein BO88DRAFT_406700 [Aspergillus vadensis CBS 113365]PYH66681.1 hypothetical protein BO88DRAFT_406700 [Aspergillus vadensis CBS 113365]
MSSTSTLISAVGVVWRYAWFLAFRPLAILVLTGATISLLRSGVSLCKDIPSMAYEIFMWFTS